PLRPHSGASPAAHHPPPPSPSTVDAQIQQNNACYSTPPTACRDTPQASRPKAQPNSYRSSSVVGGGTQFVIQLALIYNAFIRTPTDLYAVRIRPIFAAAWRTLRRASFETDVADESARLQTGRNLTSS